MYLSYLIWSWGPVYPSMSQNTCWHNSSRGFSDCCVSVLLFACRGVLADYGSVSNYCSQNSKTPVLMIPPSVADLKTQQPGGLHCQLLQLLLSRLLLQLLLLLSGHCVSSCFQPPDEQRYITRLLIKLTLKGVVFSFLFFQPQPMVLQLDGQC